MMIFLSARECNTISTIRTKVLISIRISIEPHFNELYPDLRLILDHNISSNKFLLFFNEEWLNDNSRVE